MAPTVAGAAGLAVALAIAVVPAWRIEAAVLATGLPALLPAAAPPLGMSARIALMLGAGGGVTVVLWIALTLLVEGAMLSLPTLPRARRVAAADDDAPPPVVRRADAHPDAPPRPPVRAARDLGTPFLDVTAPAAPPSEQALPRDLDVPMAAFDPTALPPQPVAPTPTVRPLFRPERSVAMPEPEPEPQSEPESEPDHVPAPSLGSLLARLDDGLARREVAVPPPPADTPASTPGLSSVLGALRAMATRR